MVVLRTEDRLSGSEEVEDNAVKKREGESDEMTGY
jgi:hypothetical protein